MILHELVPKHHFSERHHVITQATPRQLYDSIMNMDLSGSPMVRLLYSLRRMPKTSLTIEGMTGVGFTVLGIEKDREYVIGLVGRFWKPIPEIIDIPPDKFASFNEKGICKSCAEFPYQRRR